MVGAAGRTPREKDAPAQPGGGDRNGWPWLETARAPSDAPDQGPIGPTLPKHMPIPRGVFHAMRWLATQASCSPVPNPSRTPHCPGGQYGALPPSREKTISNLRSAPNNALSKPKRFGSLLLNNAASAERATNYEHAAHMFIDALVCGSARPMFASKFRKKGSPKRSSKQDRWAGQEQGGSTEKRHCSRSRGACPCARRAH